MWVRLAALVLFALALLAPTFNWRYLPAIVVPLPPPLPELCNPPHTVPCTVGAP